MADFNATLALRNDCTRGNLDGTSILCLCGQACRQSLRRLNKERRKRAKRSFVAGANCCSGHKTVLTHCH